MTKEIILEREVNEYVDELYGKYTMTVVKERALPFFYDGLKPVHRNILYSMYELGLTPDKPFKKCARVVGDTIGKYHPHGDSATYEALVKNSQIFGTRYPLIKGQGNFGSIDEPNSFAAMRYTECRLTPIAELLLGELKLNTVEYGLNFDETLKKPLYLPARMPFLLLNGTDGIAVGLSSKIPSHNIHDVKNACIKYIENPNCEIDEIAEAIYAPDFATGGQITNPLSEIKEFYKTGNGKFTVRARWKIENESHGKYKIVIYEFPIKVSPEEVSKKIKEIMRPTIQKNQKTLKQDQIQKRDFFNSLISDVNDESDSENPVRFVITPKSNKIEAEKIMGALFNATDLECTFGMIFNAIIDGKPECFNIKDIISTWVEERKKLIVKRIKNHIDKQTKILNILNGKFIAIKNIDKIIEIIKEEDEPKNKLIEVFGFNEEQAENVLDTKIRSLSSLEENKIIKDIDKTKIDIDKNQKILSSNLKIDKLLISEIISDSEQYGDERRTIVKKDTVEKISNVDLVTSAKISLVVTNNGWIAAKKGHSVDITNDHIKDGEEIQTIIECVQTDKIIAISEKGKVFNFIASQITFDKNMMHLNTIISLENDRIKFVDVFNNENNNILLANNIGFGFVINKNDLISKGKTGKQIFNLDETEFLRFVIPIKNEKYITCISDNKILSYELKEIPLISKGKGVKLIKTGDGITLDDLILSENNVIELSNGKILDIELIGAIKKRAYASIKF